MVQVKTDKVDACEPLSVVRLSNDAILDLELRLRQERTNYFPREIFADPAWDMLLFLAHQGPTSRSNSIKSLCISSGSPKTTALRHILLLEKYGLIERRCDENDGRRVFITLSDHGATAMSRMLNSCSKKSTFIHDANDLKAANRFQDSRTQDQARAGRRAK